MKISRKELKKALDVLANGLDKGSDEGYNVVLFNERGLHTSNGVVCISYPYDFDFKGAVNGEKLIKLVNNYKAEEINIEPNEDYLLLKCGRNKSKLTWQENDLETTINNINIDLPCLELPEMFTDALGLCNLKDAKNPMSGIMVADNKIYATDAIVASCYNLETEIEEEMLDGDLIEAKFWITQSNLNKILNLNEKITHYSLRTKLSNGEDVVGTYIRLRTETDVILACPLCDFSEVEDVIISLEKLLNGQEKCVTEGKLPNNFKEALGRVSQLSAKEDEKYYVTLEFTPTNLLISGESHLGSSEESLSWDEEIHTEGEQKYNYAVDLLYSFIDKANNFKIHPVNTKEGTFYALLFENDRFKHLVSSMS